MPPHRPLGPFTRHLVIQLTRALTPAEPRSDGLRKAGARAVLVGPAGQAALPFEVADSKTRVPALRPGTVSRTALVNRLRAARAFPLVLVVAPAGYGKTTLLAQWAARDPRPFAWVSVDERDDDPASSPARSPLALDASSRCRRARRRCARRAAAVWRRLPRLGAALARAGRPSCSCSTTRTR